MKCNVKLDVNDAQRVGLASLLAGKPVKRLATRDDVAGFIIGMMAALQESAYDDEPTPERVRAVAAVGKGYTPEEARKYDALIAAGKPEGYARGWIAASRRMFAGRV